MLHEHRCIGEGCGGAGGQQASVGPWGALSQEPGLSGAVLPSPPDIDECGTEMAHCRANQFCVNTEGSYECRGQAEVGGIFRAGGSPLLGAVPSGLGCCWLGWEGAPAVTPAPLPTADCSTACIGCMGAGPARCKKCNKGYWRDGAKCLGECFPWAGGRLPPPRCPSPARALPEPCLSPASPRRRGRVHQRRGAGVHRSAGGV